MDTSLYDRLGGTDGITEIVDDVVETHMNNPGVSSRFIPYRDEPERLAVIKQHTVNFFIAGSGGPVVYTGRDMQKTHRGMNISQAEYMHVMDDIFEVLNKRAIDEATQKDVLSILWSLKDMIIAQ